jgi:hypothetical protein
MTKTELKQTIKEVIQEEIQGYSKYLGKTKGGTSDEFMQILTKIAKGEDKYEGDPDKGNKILDKANPENVAKILRGEKPIYEGEGTTNIYSKYPYIKDMLNAMINKDGTVELQIYGPQGGLPKKQTAAVPLEQFTSEYVEKQVSSIFKVNDEFKKGIKQFIDSVQLN